MNEDDNDRSSKRDDAIRKGREALKHIIAWRESHPENERWAKIGTDLKALVAEMHDYYRNANDPNLDGGPEGADDYTACWVDEIINGVNCGEEAAGLADLNAFGVEIIRLVWAEIAFDPQFWSAEKRKERGYD